MVLEDTSSTSRFFTTQSDVSSYWAVGHALNPQILFYFIFLVGWVYHDSIWFSAERRKTHPYPQRRGLKKRATCCTKM
jgi:hypothetical protein